MSLQVPLLLLLPRHCKSAPTTSGALLLKSGFSIWLFPEPERHVVASLDPLRFVAFRLGHAGCFLSMCMCTYVCMYVCMYVCIVYICIYMFLCICVYIYTYDLCMSIYAYVYIYICIHIFLPAPDCSYVTRQQERLSNLSPKKLIPRTRP